MSTTQPELFIGQLSFVFMVLGRCHFASFISVGEIVLLVQSMVSSSKLRWQNGADYLASILDQCNYVNIDGEIVLHVQSLDSSHVSSVSLWLRELASSDAIKLRQ